MGIIFSFRVGYGIEFAGPGHACAFSRSPSAYMTRILILSAFSISTAGPGGRDDAPGAYRQHPGAGVVHAGEGRPAVGPARWRWGGFRALIGDRPGERPVDLCRAQRSRPGRRPWRAGRPARPRRIAGRLSGPDAGHPA